MKKTTIMTLSELTHIQSILAQHEAGEIRLKPKTRVQLKKTIMAYEKTATDLSVEKGGVKTHQYRSPAQKRADKRSRQSESVYDRLGKYARKSKGGRAYVRDSEVKKFIMGLATETV